MRSGDVPLSPSTATGDGSSAANSRSDSSFIGCHFSCAKNHHWRCYPCSWREKCMAVGESWTAMTILTVRHITSYQYRQPVSFGEHRMMLRPCESHDQRLLDSRLEITPMPTDLRWIRDVYGNHVAIARFAGQHEALRFDSTTRLDHSPADIADI